MNSYRAFLLVLSGLILLGCEVFGPDTPEAADGPLRITLDRATYSVTDEATISVTNVGPTTLYYNTCMSKTLETVADGEALDMLVYPACRCLCITALPPDSSSSFTAGFSHEPLSNLSDVHPVRFRLAFYEDNRLRHPLPDEFVATPSFTLSN